MAIEKLPKYKLKSILPCKCDLCGIGIGKYMQYYMGTWREQNHLFTEIYTIKTNNRTLRVDEWCYEDIMEILFEDN